MCQWRSLTCHPGTFTLPDIHDVPEIKNLIEKNSKATSYNLITDYGKSTAAITTTTVTPPTTNIHPMRITVKDAIPVHESGSSYLDNHHYNHHQSYHHPLSNGGIIFAITPNQGSSTTTQMLTTGHQRNLLPVPPQPVLMQYLSPNGTPHHTSIQYVQLIRPVMMIPAKPYLPAKPLTDIKTSAKPSPTYKPKPFIHTSYGPYLRSSINAAYSSPIPVFFKNDLQQGTTRRPLIDFGLNLHEYLPSFETLSQHISSILSSRSSAASQLSPHSYNPTKFQRPAQRA
ncbi:CLUMA_CG010591, isoform A [Clunio marinus]|uniref:CLUMA_CG010591, isoform A n=1 Tax=Clunio marinus TaxID=568069 RepID=A0A1J1IBS1_9DIPT|nr:CLUMA_CG010591, isoform A [Clunio marinus]